jgi:FtsP/CotA-like multicopper oxidase with cupredoxin domain
MSADNTVATPSAASQAEPIEEPVGTASSAITRRGFLRVAGLTGGGLVAVSVAACTPAAVPAWSFGAPATPGAATTPPASPTATPAASTAASAAPSAAPSASASPVPNLPAGWTEHDLNAQVKIRRFVGNLAGPLGMSPFLDNVLGPNAEPPEFTKVPHGNQPLSPIVEADGTKLFELTVDDISWPIDAVNPPVAGFGYNKMWPGPLLRVVEGDKVKVRVTNNLAETTSVHFHGFEPQDFRQDGVAFMTQLPIIPGGTFTYDVPTTVTGSLMYHAHHNSADQVGRGLLGGFIVDPKDPNERYDKKYGVTKDIVFIHNDVLGGFTINGHGFPATVPIVVTQGEKILLRFMNQGTMTHTWHTHGFRMSVVARDGAPLGNASFKCDTLGVSPAERYDAIVEANRPGVWAFHCHILPHAEGIDGFFGMTTALVVTPPG